MATRRTEAPLSDAELAAGRRADFRVYYRRRGHLYFDAMWAGTADEAAGAMRGFARELGWTIDVVRVDAIAPDA